MSATENNELNLRWIEAFNDRDWTAESDCRAADYVAHVPAAPEPLDNAGWEAFMESFTTAFPDAQIAVGGSISERNLVATRWTITGTHRGTFQGTGATGRQITMEGLDFSRVADGKILEHWAQFDMIGLMQQIGAMSGN